MGSGGFAMGDYLLNRSTAHTTRTLGHNCHLVNSYAIQNGKLQLPEKRLPPQTIKFFGARNI